MLERGCFKWATPPVRLGLSGRNSGISSGNALRAFPGNSPREYGWDPPKPYKSRHLKAPEHFQNSLPPSTAGDASFFRSGSGEGLSEPVMEFPAVLGVYLSLGRRRTNVQQLACNTDLSCSFFIFSSLLFALS